MQVTKCDICESICSTPNLVVTWEGICCEKQIIGLCEKHSKKFKSFLEQFLYKPLRDRLPKEVLDDWTEDGSTMATDSWGGAGPDCISIRG